MGFEIMFGYIYCCVFSDTLGPDRLAVCDL